jgi:MPBQ/MSBQ methyltransferase
MTIDPVLVFDRMAASYDELEPWYEHLYAVLHDLVQTELAPPEGSGALRALDAGCGTGFQTAILGARGYRTSGVDLSGAMLDIARRRYPTTDFVRGDLEALPWRDAAFDVVVSCGSTLSFVACPARAVSEIGRVLRPGGRAVLEVEHRWNLDLVWRLVSSLIGDPLGYEATTAEARAAFARPLARGITMTYPGYPRLRLFTRSELGGLLAKAGLVPLGTWGVHSLSNILPSTVLHRPRLGRVTGAAYRALRALDRALAATVVGRNLANSLIILAVKRPA